MQHDPKGDRPFERSQWLRVLRTIAARSTPRALLIFIALLTASVNFHVAHLGTMLIRASHRVTCLRWVQIRVHKKNSSALSNL
ncbi:hypothetical protein [Scytonema sp. HK-05]|uniref:hypothetical protein n=1 Tax=Scytonema sp. HK-05 TaxID=1137095 RepID=UPI000AA2FCD1|nr:hypothetical protein [Scytonema sp. HK-05]